MPSPDTIERRIVRKMITLADRWWDVIDDQITELFNDLHTQESRRLGYGMMGALDTISSEDFLGCGHWGCVYPLDIDPRFVVKLSLDPTEGPLVAALLEKEWLSRHMGIVTYLAVWQIPEAFVWRNIPRTVYVIVREEATIPGGHVIQHENPQFARAIYGKDWFSHKTQIGYLDAASKFQEASIKLREKETSRRERNFDVRYSQWAEAAHRVGNAPKGYAIEDFILNMYDALGIVITDIHLSNIGYRDHDLSDMDLDAGGASRNYYIITDPGHSIVPDPVEVPLL